jgi:hypothetical protein
MDTDRSVRESLHLSVLSVFESAKKDILVCLPDIIGSWMASCFDPVSGVSKAANEALNVTFFLD